jgi:hypothetical protein
VRTQLVDGLLADLLQDVRFLRVFKISSDALWVEFLQLNEIRSKFWEFSTRYCMIACTHVKLSQLVNKMCSQQACSKLVNKLWQSCHFIKLLQGCHSQLVIKSLNCTTITCWWKTSRTLQQACQQVVKMLLFYQVATRFVAHNLLTNCWIDNKLLEQSVTSPLSSTTL